jgi:hypothetical protein
MTFFNENFTRAGAKARLYLIDFKFPAKHALKMKITKLWVFAKI